MSLQSIYLHAIACTTPQGKGEAALAAGAMPLSSAPEGSEARPVEGEAGWIGELRRPERWQGKRVRFGRLDRLSQLVLATADEAVRRSPPPQDRLRAGVVLGTAFGSHLANEAFQQQLEQGPPEQASAALFSHTLPSVAVGELSIQLGLKGPALTVCDGINSGLGALAEACSLLNSGEAEWVICLGADVLSAALIRSWRRGDVLAEGAAALILSCESTDALARIAGITALAPGEEPGVAMERLGVAGGKRWRDYREQEALPFSERFGRCEGAAPLLGLAAELAEARCSLPLLISSRAASGRGLALALAEP